MIERVARRHHFLRTEYFEVTKMVLSLDQNEIKDTWQKKDTQYDEYPVQVFDFHELSN